MKSLNTKPTILDLKSKLMLTVFGSYETPEAIAELSALRDNMKSRGYERCKLVRDYSIPKKRRTENLDQYFNRKSIYWLLNSDACIFLFVNGVKNDGVAFELTYTSYHLEGKLETCLLAIDKKCSRYTTSLLRGKIDNLLEEEKIIQRYYRTPNELFNFCASSCISFLRIKKDYLIARGL
jgi:hypothetical protein